MAIRPGRGVRARPTRSACARLALPRKAAWQRVAGRTRPGLSPGQSWRPAPPPPAPDPPPTADRPLLQGIVRRAVCGGLPGGCAPLALRRGGGVGRDHRPIARGHGPPLFFRRVRRAAPGRGHHGHPFLGAWGRGGGGPGGGAARGDGARGRRRQAPAARQPPPTDGPPRVLAPTTCVQGGFHRSTLLISEQQGAEIQHQVWQLLDRLRSTAGPILIR